MDQTYSIDLNCDMGESYGAWSMGKDADVIPLVSSVNIACGFHAGDPATMKRTVRLALQHGVAIGAHPGLPDLLGFGRREIKITPQEAYDMVVYQIGALAAFVQIEGGVLRHVKPHGALYNMAAVQPALADAIAQAVYDVRPSLILYGLSNSALIHSGQKVGLTVAQEVFADRTYQADGTLTPRHTPDAVITDPQKACAQAVRMIQEGKVTTLQGVDHAIQADTLCLHGDHAAALAFINALHHTFQQAGINIHEIRNQ